MFGSSDEDLAIIAVASYIYLKNKKRQDERKKMRTSRFLLNPYLRARNTKDRFAKDFENMKSNPAVFYENFHMDVETFERIYTRVEQYLQPKRRTRRDIIDPKLKFAVVLKYLATGALPRHMASNYRINKSQMGLLIDVVCDALCRALKSYICKMNKEEFLNVANEFLAKWNFPNCIGAIGGKHVTLKDSYSLTLFAVADAKYKFMLLDIGVYGSEVDANIFTNSEFGKAVLNETLDFPESGTVGSTEVPFYFTGDDAFPLTQHILRPFDGQNKLSEEEISFNFHLSRARRCVENAFGILCTKWLCLKRNFFCNPKRAQKIIAACCLLHNYLLTTTNSYCPSNYGDYFNESGTLEEGEWRIKISENSYSTLFYSDLDSFCSVQNDFGQRVREVIKEFVNSPEGAVELKHSAQPS